MATNEIFKHASWVAMPLPLRGNNPAVNNDPTVNGDPVKIGSLVGFAQEVGGKAVSYTTGMMTVTASRNTANSLEPGWASVALEGAFAFPVTGWDAETMGSGTPVGINTASGSTRATLVANSEGDGWFGVIIGQTTDEVPIVRITQPTPGDTNTVADRMATGS